MLSGSLQEHPLVSVIIRTKDRPDMLRAALASVAAQTYRPIEAIVINDGGVDIKNEANAALEGHAITLVLTQNTTSLGRTGAANLGLEQASGKWSVFLDDDDLFDTEHVSTLVQAHLEQFDVNEVGIVHSQARAVAWDADNVEHFLSIEGEACDRLKLLYQNRLPIMTALFNTSIRTQVAFDAQFDLFEDWDFWLQATQFCPLQFVEAVTCTYRIHPNASNARNQAAADLAYEAIYRKWLPTVSTDDLSHILRQSHAWHRDYVEGLQCQHQDALTHIGQLHDHALEVIAQKDNNIRQLEDAYQHAISVINEKDKSIENLSAMHRQALDVVSKKDEDVSHLSSLHSHALEVIAHKDEGNGELVQLYNEAVSYIKELEASSAELLASKGHLENDLDALSKQASHSEALLRKPWYWHLYRAFLRKKH